MPTLPVVLSFGVSDGSGAGGLQADQLAIASMGCHPASVVTGIASLVDDDEPDWTALEAELLEEQAHGVLQNMAVGAFKVGTIAGADQVPTIAAILADYDTVPVVFDPHIDHAATEEDRGELATALRELLVPQSTIVTITLARARQLVGLAGDDERAGELSAAACARRIIDWGCQFVLLADAEPGTPTVVNTLYDDNGWVRSDSSPRVVAAATRFRGIGDTLSAAIAGLLAQGIDASEATHEASQYTAAAIVHAFHAGLGVAIPDRLFWAGDDDENDDAEPRDVN